jgi:D-alanyl-D-alanine carboxypeptidase (penicillin-binding protein 5/6)
MTPRQETDGLSQLTELMREERVYEPEPVEREPLDPDEQRRIRRRRLITGGVLVVLVIAFLGSYAAWALNKPVGAATATTQAFVPALPVAAEYRLPEYGESAVTIIGGDEYLPPEMASLAFGGNKAKPIASITKLITAMVILQAKPLKGDQAGPTITFSEADNDLYDEYYVLGATIAAMPIGSTMSERDALETILIPSASNYADAVSTWAFGSRTAFLNATRQWLDAKGLKHTTIVDPTGLDPRNTSTPTDLLKLARLAMADAVISDIVKMPTLAVPGMDAMANTNGLLGTDGVTGLKTGTLAEFGANLLFSASLDVGVTEPLSIAGVVLGGNRDEINSDVRVLLESIKLSFHEVQVAEGGEEVGTYTTAWGESATMTIAPGGAHMFTWSDTPIEAAIETTSLTTGEDGEKVGTITWTAGPNTASADVVLKGTIEPPTAWWRLTHPFELGD